MELWKIHRFCETATLPELLEKEAALARLVAEERLRSTNAKKVLEIIREYIELKRLFETER